MLKWVGDGASALLNLPVDRAVKLANSLMALVEQSNTKFIDLARGLGWSEYSTDANSQTAAYMEKAKKGVLEAASPVKRFAMELEDEIKTTDKKAQVYYLRVTMGLTKSQIKKLRLEEDRCRAIVKYKTDKRLKKEAAKTAENKN